MRARFFLAVALTALAVSAQPAVSSSGSRDLVAADTTIGPDGRILEARGLAVPVGDPVAGAKAFLSREANAFFGGATPDLRLSHVRESLTGTHVLLRQYAAGVEIVGSGVGVDIDNAGRIVAVHNRTAVRSTSLPPVRIDASDAEARVRASGDRSRLGTAERTLVGVNHQGVLGAAWRVVLGAGPLERYATYVDAGSGEILWTEKLFYEASGRVFLTNPVRLLNDASLRDHDNSATAVPDTAYSIVDLPGASSGGPLTGAYARIVDADPPAVAPTDSSGSLLFDRAAGGFEEVNAWYQVDRAQRYLQSLGYTGSRQIVTYPVPIDVHALAGADNSYYVPTSLGAGSLYFGDGGVDDAEDPDIILHEYGHVILDALAPSTYAGSSAGQPRGLAEGFGDYWAFSNGYGFAIASGRDPFCIGDWDARCGGESSTGCAYPAGADCLRRVDGTKTMDDYVATGDDVEHLNGEIWSSALRQIFVAMVDAYGLAEGRRRTDRLVLEGHAAPPPLPKFAAIARNILQADAALYDGVDREAICQAFLLRKILSPDECFVAPRGDLTLHQSPQRDVPIPDLDSSGIRSSISVSDGRVIERVMVRVEIEHPFRGDLRILLIGPDGRSAILQSETRAPGRNIDVTYGADAEPVEPLSMFAGTPASGTWTLQVIDSTPKDAGRLVSWGLLFRFRGDEPIGTRPIEAVRRLVIPAVARIAGDAGTDFVSDCRFFNRGTTVAHVIAWLTPSGADGTTQFAAVRLSIEPGQTVALDDVVERTFRMRVVGTLSLEGDIEALVVTSRTYNRTTHGTYGQLVPTANDEDVIGLEDGSLEIVQLRNNDSYRTNVGVTEVSGHAGVVRVEVFDAAGVEIETSDWTVAPFSNLQQAILGGRGGMSVDAARVRVRVVGGAARVVAYGSVIDHASGDPIYVPGVRRASGIARSMVPAVFRVDGRKDTRWTSDLWLTNPGDEAREATVLLRRSDGSAEASFDRTVASGSTLVLADLIGETFGLETAKGSLDVDGQLIATTRSWTAGESGSFGQFIPSRNPGESIGFGDPPADMIQLEISDRYRTNAGVRETAGHDAVVRLRVFDAAGEELFTRDYFVPANGQMQAGLDTEGVPPFTDGRASIEVVSGEGRVLVYASVIDNISGDPVYIPGRREPDLR